MPLSIAMPIAHVAAGTDYERYYRTGHSIFFVTHYFNDRLADGRPCQGLRMAQAVTFPPVQSEERELFNLYAFADGFLSLQGNDLVLRLPRELMPPTVSQYNSGRQFFALTPPGPQLRHVVYRFENGPVSAVRGAIEAILRNPNHPSRLVARYPLPERNSTQRLDDFLDARPEHVTEVLERFLNGQIELFARAGDVAGNFCDTTIEICFLDSCGTLTPTERKENSTPDFFAPPAARGRPLNPAYFLYLVRSSSNSRNVTLLTRFPPISDWEAYTHPLDYILSRERLAYNGVNPDLILDVAASQPPKPLLCTVDVINEAGQPLADRGIAIASLGLWHQSRNAGNPYSTTAPVQWRYVDGEADEVQIGDLCDFRSQVRPGQTNLLPGAAFDHTFAPNATQEERVRLYWTRYGTIINRVASAFELPCELILAIACKETAGGTWFDAANAELSHEMDVIRAEPVTFEIAVGAAIPTNAAQIAQKITSNTAYQTLLTQYIGLAGLRVTQGQNSNTVLSVGPNGANAQIPIPWSDSTLIDTGNALNWGNLRTLVGTFTSYVRVSPGIMQTLVSTAHEDLEWIGKMYGPDYLRKITITHNNIVLAVDTPPEGLGALFSDWLGVTVDNDGNNNPVGSPNTALSRQKRSLHSIVAGGAHIKRRYNTVEGNNKPFNLITDFDLPTVASGYNNGAEGITAANPTDSVDHRWSKLFALKFYDHTYTELVPRYFNAAISYFNGAPDPRPALRLWRS